MTTTYRQRGRTLSITTAGAVSNGALVKLSHTIGVAMKGAAGAGDAIPVALEGVFEVPKVAGAAWALGEKLIYKAATNSFANAAAVVASGDVTGAAFAMAAAASADTTGLVKLRPGNTTLTP